MSALVAMPASGLAAPPLSAQKPALSRACIQMEVCTPEERGIVNSPPPTRDIFHVDAALHDKEVVCQGERLHVFELSVSGDPVVVLGVLNMVKLLNEAATSVCGNNLYVAMNAAQQALVIQQIRIANSCIEDSESALADGDSQTGLARVSSAVTAFQAAGQRLIQGADRALAVGAAGDAAKRLLQNSLDTLGVAGRGASSVIGQIEGASARHLLKEILEDFAEEKIEDATLDASDLDGRVANALASDYDRKVNQSLTGFVGSYRCP